MVPTGLSQTFFTIFYDYILDTISCRNVGGRIRRSDHRLYVLQLH